MGSGSFADILKNKTIEVIVGTFENGFTKGTGNTGPIELDISKVNSGGEELGALFIHEIAHKYLGMKEFQPYAIEYAMYGDPEGKIKTNLNLQLYSKSNIYQGQTGNFELSSDDYDDKGCPTTNLMNRIRKYGNHLLGRNN